jgi:hypothetical protein
MRRTLVALGAAALALAAGLLVSLLLLGPASGSDDKVGRLNPRQTLPQHLSTTVPPPAATTTAPVTTGDDHGGNRGRGGDDDD